MKIAIYHDLAYGGALRYISCIANWIISNTNHDIEVFTPSINKYNLFNPIISQHTFTFQKSNNIFINIIKILFELNNTDKIISQKLNRYDVIIVCQSENIQSPHILRFLKSTKTIYICHEPKREFYEITSFDHNSIRRIFARLIRIAIKFLDLYNCRKAKLIISNSYYSQNIINKIYRKKSIVIYPGLQRIKVTKRYQSTKNSLGSIGSPSYIKGYSFTANQLEHLIPRVKNFYYFGNDTYEKKYYQKLFQSKKIKLIRIKNKLGFFKKINFYIANNSNEPFGIATLEGSTNYYVIGRNNGGTSEIIYSGINGQLYPNNKKLSVLIIQQVLSKNRLQYYQIGNISWKYSAQNLLRVIEYNLTNKK